MTIPSNLRAPGPKSEISFVENPNAVSVINNSIVIVAEKSAAGTGTVEVPTLVTDASQSDTLAGVGSLAALMSRGAFAIARQKGRQPNIYLCLVAEPAGGAKAVQTLTVTASGVIAGNLVFSIAGRVVTVGVSTGDTANSIATAIKNAIDEQKLNLPVTATVATNVVTCTFLTKGTNGNDVQYSILSQPTGVTVVAAVGTAGSGVTTVANALAALYNARYNGVALANHTTTDIAAALVDIATAWTPGVENFRHYFVAETASIGAAQALQAAANDKALTVLACELCPTLPGEIAAQALTAWLGYDQPTVNMDGEQLLVATPPGSYAFTPTEQEVLLAGGVTPIAPVSGVMAIIRLVTSKITENGAPFEPTREPAYVRMAAYLAEICANDFRTQFRQETLTPQVLKRIRASVITRHRSLEGIGWLKDVDVFLDMFSVTIDVSVSGRVKIVSPFRVAGPLHQAYYNHVMYM